MTVTTKTTKARAGMTKAKVIMTVATMRHCWDSDGDDGRGCSGEDCSRMVVAMAVRTVAVDGILPATCSSFVYLEPVDLPSPKLKPEHD